MKCYLCKMNKTFGPTNFHKHTFCIFAEADFSEVQGLRPNYSSKTGSKYYFTEKGVYRYANHWSRVAQCRWRLVGQSRQRGFRLGYADWDSFYPDSETGAIYFIDRTAGNGFQYFHRNCDNYNGQTLRTASETAKVLTEIQKLFLPDSWLAYVSGDRNQIREQVLHELLFSNKSKLTLKKELLGAGS